MLKNILAHTVAMMLLSSSALSLFAQAPACADDHNNPSKPGVKTIATVPVYPGAGSGHAAINTRTNRVYISNFYGSSASVLDGDWNKILYNIPIVSSSSFAPNGAGPTASAIDEETNTIYALTNNGTISVIDGKYNQVKSNFIVDSNNTGPDGLATQDMVYSHKTGKLYVSSAATQIDVIEPKNQKVLSVIPDDNATFLAINQRTNTIYATQYWDGTVWVINGDTDQVVATIPGVGQPAVPDDCYLPANNDCTNQGSGLDHVAVDEETDRLYVVGTNDGRFVTIDGNTNTVINTQFIGGNQYNVAANPLSHVAYSVSDLSSTLAVVDGKTGNPIIENISVGSPPTATSIGSLPQGIAFNPKTGKLYVVDFGDLLNEPAVSTVVVLQTFGGDDGGHQQASNP